MSRPAKTKVVYKCIDCGKESTPKYPSQFQRSEEEYRCKDCAEKLKIQKEITYQCIDCGKEKTGRPSTFHKPREEYRCFDCSMKHRDADPNYISAIKSAGLKRRKQRITRICVDCGKEKTGLPSEFPSMSDDEEYRCKKCANRKRKNSKGFCCVYGGSLHFPIAVA